MKTWEKVIACFAATIVFMVAACAVGIVLYPTEEMLEEPSNPPIESEDTNRTVEPAPAPEISIEEIYGTVELGMTEAEVRAIAGEPDMVSTSEIEGLGNMKDLTYNGGLMANVSIFLEDGKVRMVLLGTVNDSGDIDTKTKM